MVYLLNTVIFHGYVSHNQMVHNVDLFEVAYGFVMVHPWIMAQGLVDDESNERPVLGSICWRLWAYRLTMLIGTFTNS